jgi:hypothetical protein
VSLAVSGGYGEGETPLPIPNRAVKPLSADGTWLARAWESRSPPVYLCEPRQPAGLAFVVRSADQVRAAGIAAGNRVSLLDVAPAVIVRLRRKRPLSRWGVRAT